MRTVAWLRPAALLAAGLWTATSAAPAAAQTSVRRTFVSGKGSDTNPCAITAPCRSLQAAVNVTAAGGEVVILDPAGYGVVTITQSITIANDGVGTASISVPSAQTGITITAGAGATVQLRGLEIDGDNIGNVGILVGSVGTLSVVNCVVRHLQVGLYVTAGDTAISNSIVSDQYGYVSNGGSFGDGIIVLGGTVQISNAALSGNTNNAIFTKSYYSSATAIIDHDTIVYNKFGLSNGGGTIESYQNNNISRNTAADTSGTITAVTPK